MNKAVFDRHLSELNQHHDRLSDTSIVDLFEQDPERFDHFSARNGPFLFDYSKNCIDADALNALLSIAEKTGVAEYRDRMFAGDIINETEGRAVLHTALRCPETESVYVDGQDVIPKIHQVIRLMEDFCAKVRSGEYQVTGGQVTDIVNIGIGGSDLGPRMAVLALSPFVTGPKVHHVSNVDGADLSDMMKNLDLKTTLFVVASKTFTTQETMTNAHSARAILEEVVGADKAADHFVALSSNLEATGAFGIPPERTFGFWNWVGGRYSVWSAVGLSLMLAIGRENFRAFLRGGHDMDCHFRKAPLAKNIPVLMALIGIWHRNVCDYPAYALLPYDDRLSRLAAWLQQLDMESNGKSVTMSGEAMNCNTGPIVFGEPGTNGQHAFYQLIHQGTTVIPCDFLIAAKSHEPEMDHHHRLLVANCLAQSEALMRGRSLDEAQGNHHRVFSGNRPSNTLLYEVLDPHTLGMLLALFEHKVFVQGVIWGINSFDQWGVELGKELAKTLEPMIESGANDAANNGSTAGLLSTFFQMRKD
ncbi:MAG: glucose-6-phosphate isomerase [Pseudomonadota bacterium]